MGAEAVASAPLPPLAVWRGFAGSGPAAHVYHANGFTPGVYAPLLDALEPQLRIAALALRPTSPGVGAPPRRRDWQLYADDLVAFLDAHAEGPVIGIGHSLGATCTVLAAVRRPDLFSALALIEPAMVSRPLAWLMRQLPKAVVALAEPARGALRQPDTWPDREAFLAHCRGRRSLRRLGPAALAYSGVVDLASGGVRLAFPKDWESHNYTQPPNVMREIAALRMPCVALRGRPSVFFTEVLWQSWRRRCPGTVFMEAPDFGHLLPLEDPAGCSRLIVDGLARALALGGAHAGVPAERSSTTT